MEWLPSMFSFLGTTSGVIIIIVLVVLLLLLGVIGKVNLKFGKNIVTFGKIVAKRSCGDCILLVMSKRERMDSQRSFITNRILKEQMNFVEQKILEMNGMFLSSYRMQLHELADKNTSESELNKQYRLYQGLLASTMQAIKDEFRRSFKENGFEEMSGQEFTHYVKQKLGSIVSLGRDHLFNLYPYEGMIVSAENRMKWLDSKLDVLEDVCFEIYVKAKEIKVDAVKKVTTIEKEFSKEIDEFLQARS
jgi:hypothetical protein